MTIQQLKYVLMVSEAGSITEAAKKLFISQPSLSNAIREIEKEAGISIFSRSRTGITLTKEGMEFLGYARQVIRQMELLEDRYITELPPKIKFGVSAHHYTFTEKFSASIREYKNLYVWDYGTDRIYCEIYNNISGTFVF